MNVAALLSRRAQSGVPRVTIYAIFSCLALGLGWWLIVRLQQLTLTDAAAALSNSLSLGSILILTALGLAITFGVMGVINMAHGEMLMLGAYTAFVVTDPQHLGLNLFCAIPISFAAVALVGYLMEVCLVRFLYGRPLDTLLATWGVGMILQQTVNLKFGANLQAMHLPEMLQGGWNIGQVTIPVYRVFIVGVTALCLLAVYLWFYRTSFGLKIRAVVQNRAMASALGVSTRLVDSLTFAFAAGLAGVAGCILAHLYNVKYNMGNDYIVDAFMVVILGGMGQLGGAVGGGAIIGTANSFTEKLLGNTSMARVLVLVAVIALIFIRPSGLFRTKGRSYE
jgi:urea transport system permease protein